MGITCNHNYLCFWLCTSNIWVNVMFIYFFCILENLIFNLILIFIFFFIPSQKQKRSKCILQSIIGQCSDKCIAFTSTNATITIYTRIFCLAIGRRFLPLFILFNNFLICQSIHSDFIASGFVCNFTCSQLFTHFIGCKWLINSSFFWVVKLTIFSFISFSKLDKIRGGVHG